MLSTELKQKIEKWTTSSFDPETAREVRDLLTRAESDERAAQDLREKFLLDLKFGTGGLRAVMGIGTNRMNVYTLRKTVQGIANYIQRRGRGSGTQAACLGYDTRINSRSFAREAACVFAANGIKAYVFAQPRPTPMLSFATRHLGCTAGAMVTASHNPKEYNGFKVYSHNGQQVLGKVADDMIAAANAVDFRDIRTKEFELLKAKGMIVELGPEMDDEFISVIRPQSLSGDIVRKHADELAIVFTSIHGTGGQIVPRALQDWGFSRVAVVAEQQEPDGNFPTVHSPNPEEKAALDLAIKEARRQEAALVLGTDPDADRVGIAIRTHAGEYRLMSGQEVAAMLTYYLLSRRRELDRLPPNAAVVSTIVTTDLLSRICADFGVEFVETLTGFKYIGQHINRWDEGGVRAANPEKFFVFGGEESYGYLIGTHARDKDAVVSCCCIAEMAAWARNRDQTLEDLLDEIHARYGVYHEDQLAIKLEGLEGMRMIEATMKHLREDPPREFVGVKLTRVRDIERGAVFDAEGEKLEDVDLPRENVLELCFGSSFKVTARPSGTEPKIKFYIAATDIEETIEKNELPNRRIRLSDRVAEAKKLLNEIVEKVVEEQGAQTGAGG